MSDKSQDYLSERYQESIESKIDADTIHLKDLNKTIVAFCRLTQLNYFKIQEIGSSIVDINRELKRLSDALKKLDGTSEDEKNKILLAGVDSDCLGLYPRTYHCLLSEKIVFIHELILRTEKDLLKIPNLGRKSIREIKAVLERYGLCLKDS